MLFRAALGFCIIGLIGQGAPGEEPQFRVVRDRTEKDGRVQDRMVVARKSNPEGKPTLYVTVPFKIIRSSDNLPTDEVLANEIIVRENGRRPPGAEVHPPRDFHPLTVVLAIDTSGSMVEHGKMDEAKQSARQFLEKLNPRAPCGLILFNHRIRDVHEPTTDREALFRPIAGVVPRGGTAYQDAVGQALRMLRTAAGRKAVVVLTDGVDLNSRQSLQQVIAQAREDGVPVYAIGVGAPSALAPVSTVLVLDCSGSMERPADSSDRLSKMEALQRAATRFVEIMRPGSRLAVMPFSSSPDARAPFSSDKHSLVESIRSLRPGGQTALFDAVMAALGKLASDDQPGKRSVVVLTDGQDTSSETQLQEVLNAAGAVQIPLHVLGLGRKGELNEAVLRNLARSTSGSYHHCGNEQSLLEVFEQLAIRLHDDGVDEAALRSLALDTGGMYYSASDVAQLGNIYAEVAEDLRATYTVTFPSLHQDDDGTSRDIEISVWRHGRLVSDVLLEGYNVPGVVVPELDVRVYLTFLAGLGGLLLLPVIRRRRTGEAGASP